LRRCDLFVELACKRRRIRTDISDPDFPAAGASRSVVFTTWQRRRRQLGVVRCCDRR